MLIILFLHVKIRFCITSPSIWYFCAIHTVSSFICFCMWILYIVLIIIILICIHSLPYLFQRYYFPLSFVLHPAKWVQGSRLHLNRPSSHTTFIQGHLEPLSHAINCSHWLIIVWGPSFSLSGRFLLHACVICEEKMEKGEHGVLYVWTSAPLLHLFTEKNNVARSAYRSFSYHHIGTRLCVCFLFCPAVIVA